MYRFTRTWDNSNVSFNSNNFLEHIRLSKAEEKLFWLIIQAMRTAAVLFTEYVLFTWSNTPLSRMFQLYHCVSCVSYCYFLSRYPDTREPVVILTPQSRTQRRESYQNNVLVWSNRGSNPRPLGFVAGLLPVDHRAGNFILLAFAINKLE